MNKSILALAVAAVSLASVAQAATVFDKDGTSLAVYGRVQSILYNGDQSNESGYNDNSIDTSARLGLDMRSAINQYVSAFAKAEWEASNADNGSNDFKARYLWVGADFNQFGTLKAGKFEDAIKFAISPTDIFEDFGCVAQLGNDDRRSGQIMYEWAGYGVDFKLSGQTANSNQPVDGAYFGGEKLDINAGFAASIGYTSPDVLFGPIAVRAGYSYAQFQDEKDFEGPTDDDGNKFAYDDYKQYAVSASWGGSTGFYTAVMYSNREFTMFDGGVFSVPGRGKIALDDYTVQGVEFVLRYGFQNGISIFGGWQWQNIDMDGEDGVDLDASVLNLEVDWQVTPNFKIWTEARWDLDTDEGYDTFTNGVTKYEEDLYSVGARYTF